MNLEPLIQSEVSQKEKDKYCILMHIYGIQKNGTEELMLLNCGVGESLDCKEIQPVYPKGDQSWVSIGRTAAEDETPIL